MTKRNALPDGWRELKTEGFVDLVGPLLRAGNREDGYTYGLLTRDEHKNPIGIVHGGVLTTLLDQVIAITAWNAADRQSTLTVQMDTRFLGAAKVGDFLEVRAIVRQATRSLIFVDADITSAARPIASATAVMKISQKPEPKT